jgi:hypothetical protein
MIMPYARPIRTLLCCSFFILVLVSCTGLPVTGNLPPGIALEQITRIPANSPFAPDPAGKQVALMHNGLALLDVTTRNSAPLSPDTPQAIAWAPDGQRLAAAFLREHGSQVRIYDTGGSMLGSIVITGRVSTLLWRGENELLIAAMEVKAFSFGVNFVQVFYRWDNGKPPERIELHNSTLRTKVNQELGPDLYRLFTFALSPYGDAIVYSRLLDPPAFSPYLRYILRNLATGSEREVASATLNFGGAIFAGGDDLILCGNGIAETVLRDPWYERNLTVFPHSGRSLAASGGGKTLLIDGNLFRAGQQLFSFPVDAIGLFTADGSLLFVRQGNRLWLVSGLPPDPAPIVPAGNRDRFLTLRQWRSDGLINPADLTKASEQMEKP